MTSVKEQKIALITGVSKGIGREMVYILAKQGYQVHGISRSKYEHLDVQLQSQLFQYYCLDLADIEKIKQKIFQNIKQLDLLILNASEKSFKNFAEFSIPSIEQFIISSLSNQLIILNHYLKIMLKENQGRIIIISSKSGLKGYSTGSLYCGIKGAWIRIHESISREIKFYNISITTLLPDSFSDRAGIPNKNYKRTISVISKLLHQIDKKTNSQIITILSPKSKILMLLNYLQKAFNL